MTTTKLVNPLEIEREEYHQEWRENRFFEISSALCRYCENHACPLLHTRDAKSDIVDILMHYVETPYPFPYSDQDMLQSKLEEDEVYDP